MSASSSECIVTTIIRIISSTMMTMMMLSLHTDGDHNCGFRSTQQANEKKKKKQAEYAPFCGAHHCQTNTRVAACGLHHGLSRLEFAVSYRMESGHQSELGWTSQKE